MKPNERNIIILARDIILDNTSADETRPHPDYTDSMIKMLMIRSGCDEDTARGAIEAAQPPRKNL
jgi:hypothetical protein